MYHIPGYTYYSRVAAGPYRYVPDRYTTDMETTTLPCIIPYLLRKYGWVV